MEASRLKPKDSTCADMLLGNGFSGAVITRKLLPYLRFFCNSAEIALLAHLRPNKAGCD